MPSSGWAARLTDVADAADVVRIGNYEHDDNFDAYIGTEVSFLGSAGTISRERPDSCSAMDARDCIPVDELNWSSTRAQIRLRAEAGIYRDLSLTLSLPIQLAGDTAFDYASGVGQTNSSVDGAAGNLFRHDYSYAQSGVGDLGFGLRWAPLNDERDESGPNWVTFVNWQMPWTSQSYLPNTHSANAAIPMGDGVHRVTIGTALSKRVGNYGLVGIDRSLYRRGYLDPYIKFQVTLPFPERNRAGSELVHSPLNNFGNKPSHMAEVEFGMEIVPIEDLRAGQRLVGDLGVRTTFYSEGRNATVLTAPLRERTLTEQFIEVAGKLAVVGRPSKYVRLALDFLVGLRTGHFLTTENIGNDTTSDGQVTRTPAITGGRDELNPYYCGNPKRSTDGPDDNPLSVCSSADPGRSYDQIGFRFKSESHRFWQVIGTATLTL